VPRAWGTSAPSGGAPDTGRRIGDGAARKLDHQRGDMVRLQHVPADVAEEITLSLTMGTAEGRIDSDGEVYTWRLEEPARTGQDWATRAVAALQKVQSVIGADLLTHPLPELVDDLRAASPNPCARPTRSRRLTAPPMASAVGAGERSVKPWWVRSACTSAARAARSSTPRRSQAARRIADAHRPPLCSLSSVCVAHPVRRPRRRGQ
jgi:hypothetical protein